MQLPKQLARYQDLIEDELRSLLADQTQPLYQMMRYQLGWIDETGSPQDWPTANRLHASLCLLSCDVLGGNVGTALPSAAGVELAHNCSLVHDDIEDGNPERNSRSTVWWVWGPAQAINAGDGLHAMARLSLFRLADKGCTLDSVLRAVRYLDEACLKLCEGQYLDLSYRERTNVSQVQYHSMAKGKTGAMMACAMELGALLAGAEESLVDAFGHLGRQLGIAFQIRRDIMDLWGSLDPDKPLPMDVLNKKRGFPVIHAMEKASPKQRRTLGSIYFKRGLEPKDVQTIVQVLDDLGTREEAQQTAITLAQEALSTLQSHGITKTSLDELRVMADYLVHQEE